MAPGSLRSLSFSDLELHRIIGTGQFGAVRLVRSKVTNEVFALKVRGLRWRIERVNRRGGKQQKPRAITEALHVIHSSSSPSL